MKRYAERVKTQSDHQQEIRRTDGLRDFAEAEEELAAWVAARAWTSGDGPKAIFLDAMAWLRERKVLLPGVTTLARLVARVRDDTTHRLWRDAGGAADRRSSGACWTGCWRSRRGSGSRTWSGGARGRRRAAAARRSSRRWTRSRRSSGLGLAGLGAEARVPPRRLVELARYGMTADAWLIRRHPDDRRLATLLATARHLEAKSVDDALELLDLLMSTELLDKAQREADKEQGPQAPPAGQGVGPARGRGGGAVRVRRLGRPGRGAAGVAGVGGDRGGHLARGAARRADVVSETVPPPGAEDPDDWRAGLLERITRR